MSKSKSKLEKFIKANGLTFKGTGSDLNSDCCIISGYADFLGVSQVSEINEAIIKVDPKVGEDFMPELKRVFDFAYTYNYGNFWKSDEAAKQYKF